MRFSVQTSVDIVALRNRRCVFSWLSERQLQATDAGLCASVQASATAETWSHRAIAKYADSLTTASDPKTIQDL